MQVSQAFNGLLSNGDQTYINLGSNFVDSLTLPNFQGPNAAYMHAMSSPTLSKAEALKKYCKFIEDNMNDYFARSGDRRTRPGALFSLGKAMHAVMDSTSPAHRGFQLWTGLRDPRAHLHGPSVGGIRPSTIEDMSNVGPYLDETIGKMLNVLSGGRPPECDCVK